jgi:hypothetical protein
MQTRLDELPAPPPGREGWPWTDPSQQTFTEPPGGWPRLTIITPSYQQGAYLEETLRSVLMQGYPNLEFMVFDGGSTDGSYELLERYSPFLTYWTSAPDAGQSDAINQGLARATGAGINWLNSDDFYLPGALFRIGQMLAEQPAVQCIAGRSRYFRADGYARESRGTDVYPSLPKTLGWARIDQPETFFRAEAVAQMGPLNPALHYCMDREWWMRFLLHYGVGPVQRLDALLVNFRLHAASKTVSLGPEFERERDGLFLGLAEAIGATATAATIRSWYPQSPPAAMPPQVPAALFQQRHSEIYAALQYFLLLAASEFYEKMHLEQARRVLRLLDPGPLAAVDRERRTTLLRRSRLPRPLLQLARRFSR